VISRPTSPIRIVWPPALERNREDTQHTCIIFSARRWGDAVAHVAFPSGSRGALEESELQAPAFRAAGPEGVVFAERTGLRPPYRCGIAANAFIRSGHSAFYVVGILRSGPVGRVTILPSGPYRAVISIGDVLMAAPMTLRSCAGAALAAMLAACSTVDGGTQPGAAAVATAPALPGALVERPTSMRREQLVGRWGVASFREEKDRPGRRTAL
jgi:hypothetical protein